MLKELKTVSTFRFAALPTANWLWNKGEKRSETRTCVSLYFVSTVQSTSHARIRTTQNKELLYSRGDRMILGRNELKYTTHTFSYRVQTDTHSHSHTHTQTKESYSSDFHSNLHTETCFESFDCSKYIYIYIWRKRQKKRTKEDTQTIFQ